jgi:hypothetical protein
VALQVSDILSDFRSCVLCCSQFSLTLLEGIRGWYVCVVTWQLIGFLDWASSHQRQLWGRKRLSVVWEFHLWGSAESDLSSQTPLHLEWWESSLKVIAPPWQNEEKFSIDFLWHIYINGTTLFRPVFEYLYQSIYLSIYLSICWCWRMWFILFSSNVVVCEMYSLVELDILVSLIALSGVKIYFTLFRGSSNFKHT